MPLRSLVRLTEASPVAHAHAARWRTLRRRSVVMLGVATGLIGVARIESLSEGVRVTAAVAGASAVTASSVLAAQSGRHFSRALWHYNGTFAAREGR